MATTTKDIAKWFERGKEEGFDYMIVACDTYDWSDYPIFTHLEDFYEKHARVDSKNMQKIMEVYDLAMDMEQQLIPSRIYNYPHKKG